jgi:TonB-linked SusC/RagA family outer membrane protein
MKNKLMLLCALLVMSIGAVMAQTTTVQGIVTSDEDGQPVIGASVMVVGTSLGAITDLDGKFTINNVPSSAKTLQVSFIGMQTQEVSIKPGTMKVVMKSDAELLDEVVISAYGEISKGAFTGSAGTVTADQIGKIQTSNVTNALTGKVAGVQTNTTTGQPGQSNASIRIRGISSINAGNDPLIIMDGVPYDGDLNNISSQDIESMTVLKDAASNSLYGARGANGVIMITTKKGDKGQARVTVDAKWGSNTRATQDYNFIDSPAQYYEMYYGALKNYYTNVQGYSDFNAHVAANNNLTSGGSNGLAYNVYTVPNGQYMIGENGKLNPAATLGRVVSYKGEEYLLKPDNWLDAAYKSSMRQEYNVSTTAGNDKASFFASFNYLNNEGIIDRSGFERLTGRIKSDYQIKEWLKIGANFGFTHFDAKTTNEDGSSNSSGNIFAIATQIAPIYPLFIRDGKGNIMYDSNGLKRYDYGDGSNAGASRPILTSSNAISDNLLDTSGYEGNAMSAVGFFEVRFLKNFKFTSTNSFYVDETRQTSITNPYYGSYASSNGIVYKYHTRQLAYNYQQLLNYKKEIGNHNIDVMLGHEAYRYKYYYLYGHKTNMFDPNNPELNGAVLDGSSGSYTTDYNTEGFFGRAQYNFAEKYFGAVSYRRDASSRFHPDNRWGNFWSLSGAWMLTKEDWFSVDWINELKFKASFGQQGNDNIGNYRYVSTYNIVNSSGKPAATPSTLGNKAISWETSSNFNVGFDFGLFNDRLSGSIEYFYRKTTDMLFSFPLPPSFGYTSYYANVGDMVNSGVEVDLTATILKNNDLEWDVNLNLTAYKNKISYLPDERKTMKTDNVYGYSGSGYYYGEGIPLWTFITKKFVGINEDGQPLYYKDVYKLDENGIAIKGPDGFNIIEKQETTTNYSEASNYLCGTALPDAYGGFGTSFKYKGFDLSMDFAYQLGGQVYDSDYAASMASPTANSKGSAFHADLLKAWTPSSHSSSIPRFQFGDLYSASSSDRFLTDASFLSLQNISLGYTFPSRWCRTIGLEKLRIYGTADNVWLWSKRQGLDPRQSITGSVTNSYYAPIRTISGGITLTF